MEQHDCDESRTLFEIHAERSQNCHRFCKTPSQQKHVVLQSAAPLQLRRFKVGSKMAKAASAAVLPYQKKQCCKIARFIFLFGLKSRLNFTDSMAWPIMRQNII
jgi:hypothetical protein